VTPFAISCLNRRSNIQRAQRMAYSQQQRLRRFRDGVDRCSNFPTCHSPNEQFSDHLVRP